MVSWHFQHLEGYIRRMFLYATGRGFLGDFDYGGSSKTRVDGDMFSFAGQTEVDYNPKSPLSFTTYVHLRRL